jgi:rubredoxin
MNPPGVSKRIIDSSRLECRICWHVYDPAVGDALEQVPPGTPFSALPEYWRCPQCDAEQDKFLPLADE